MIQTVFNSFLAASFLNKLNPIFFLRNSVLHVFRTLSAILVSQYPNDMTHQVLVLLDRDDVPSL